VVKKLISIVIPVFNEEGNIVPCYEALNKATAECANYDFEFVFTDNHSSDNTFSLLKKLATKDHRVRVFRFAKNFGYQRSIYTGYMKAQGAAAIAFDCDLQDPPEMIAQFLQQWEQGYQVVYGVRRRRQEAAWLHMLRKVFYRLINFLSENELPLDAGDFRLLDKQILDLLREVEEPQPYLRGIIASFGFNQIGIPYDRHERKRGDSKFPLKQLVKLSIDGIISQSIVPLRLATYFGLVVAMVTFLAILIYLFAHFIYGADWPRGFATLTMLVLFSVSLNAMFLGIIGEYLGRIYSQMKKHPITIIETEVDIQKRVE
jgi:polyisoprenyl-phosphate glycosyltransferase